MLVGVQEETFVHDGLVVGHAVTVFPEALMGATVQVPTLTVAGEVVWHVTVWPLALMEAAVHEATLTQPGSLV